MGEQARDESGSSGEGALSDVQRIIFSSNFFLIFLVRSDRSGRRSVDDPSVRPSARHIEHPSLKIADMPSSVPRVELLHHPEPQSPEGVHQH